MVDEVKQAWYVANRESELKRFKKYYQDTAEVRRAKALARYYRLAYPGVANPPACERGRPRRIPRGDTADAEARES